MASGKELVGVFPTEAEYGNVKKKMRTVLKDIFNNDATLETVRFMLYEWSFSLFVVCFRYHN